MSARTLIQLIIDCLVQDDSTQVRRELFGDAKGGALSNTIVVFMYDIFFIFEDSETSMMDRQLVPFMRGISKAYENASNWPTHRYILSIVAPKVPLYLVRSFIPSVTRYRFTSARFHADPSALGTFMQHPPPVIFLFLPEQVEHFIDFIVSDYVCTDVPFGERILKLSDGTKLLVPDTIRNYQATRIISQYYKYTAGLFPEF